LLFIFAFLLNQQVWIFQKEGYALSFILAFKWKLIFKDDIC